MMSAMMIWLRAVEATGAEALQHAEDDERLGVLREAGEGRAERRR